jgi:YbbR domain-containing protein
LNAIRQENLPPVDVQPKSVEEPAYYFEKEAFDLPTGVTMVAVVPPLLSFKWVPQASRELPVELSLDGELPDDLEWAGEAEVFPLTVEVEGPRDVVNSMRTVRAMEMDVSALGVGVTHREIPLVGAPANTTFESPSVLVTLRVQPKMVERVLFPLRVDAEGAVPRSLRPRAVTARIRGPQSAVNELNPASVLAIVNLSELEPQQGIIRVPVELRGLPDGVEVIEVEPAEVIVQLEEL